MQYAILTSPVHRNEFDELVRQLNAYAEQGWTVVTVLSSERDPGTPMIPGQPPLLIFFLAKSPTTWNSLITEWTMWFAENCPEAEAADFITKFREEFQEFTENPSMDEAVDCFATLLAWSTATDDPRTFREAIQDKLELVKTRRYERLPDGTYHHVKPPKDLVDAVHQVTRHPEIRSRHPEGFSAADALEEIVNRWGADAFPLVSVIDVADALQEIYG